MMYMSKKKKKKKNTCTQPKHNMNLKTFFHVMVEVFCFSGSTLLAIIIFYQAPKYLEKYHCTGVRYQNIDK